MYLWYHTLFIQADFGHIKSAGRGVYVHVANLFCTKVVMQWCCEHHGKKSFHQSNCIPDVKFFDNLSGWTLANTCNTMLE